jgi:hypothetical protein
LGGSDYSCLTFDARSRVANLLRTIIIDGRAANDGVNGIAISYRFG